MILLNWTSGYRYSYRTGIEYYHTDMLGSVMMTTSSEAGLMTNRLQLTQPSAAGLKARKSPRLTRRCGAVSLAPLRANRRYHYDVFGNNYTGSLAGSNSLGYGGKRYDAATALYDYGFRDYDSTTGRFTTVDPIRDGVNWYVYCNNDPVNFFDLWGLEIKWKQGENATIKDIEDAKKMAENIAASDTTAGENWRELEQSKRTVTIEVNRKGNNDATPGNNSILNPIEAVNSAIGIGGNAYVRFDPTDYNSLSDGTVGDAESTLAHEVSGHAYSMVNGTNPITRKGRELEATAVENEYRASKGIEQRNKYGGKWDVEQYPSRKAQISNLDLHPAKDNKCSK